MMDMLKAIKNAAMLRNRIETCLRASPDPMTGRELFDWPSIQELLGSGKYSYSKFNYHLSKMVKVGTIIRSGSGNGSSYTWNKESVDQELKKIGVLPVQDELKIRIDRQARALTFLFEGMRITIEMVK